MANAYKWSNVQVLVQSALASAKTITAIAVGATATVTSTSHGYSNGDYVLISASGMYQVDGRVFRVSATATNTFVLEGEDTSAFDAFTSGTAKLITFGTTMTTATGLSAAGGEFDFIDTTTIHTNVRSQIPGLASAANYTFDSLWDPADTGLVALKSASDSQAQRAIHIKFAGNQRVLFNGYVGATLLPTGNAQDLVKTSVTLTMFGKPTIYAT